MNKKAFLALTIVAVSSMGCGTTGESRDSRVVNVKLDATRYNAGEIAQATLVAQGGETGINLFLSDVPDGVALPPHLYTYIYPGACHDLGAEPAYEMNRTVLPLDYMSGTSSAGMRLSKRAPVALDTLQGGDYSLVVRTSPADGNQNIFCGSLRG